MEKEIKAVIGANFGDEGKGLMADYFCHKLAQKGHAVLNIRHNGGAQAAHNVVTPDGKQHVFSHFGSGSFTSDIDTYLSEDYILNPMIFCRELEELEKLGMKPKVYINRNCRITTPYDMIVNQALERQRGDGRHGSCGLGINETVERYRAGVGATIGEFSDAPYGLWDAALFRCRNEYFLNRIKALSLLLTDEEITRLCSDIVTTNYVIQLNQMLNYCTLVDDSIIKNYSGIVFEGAQGLLLDTDYFPFAPHLTSSKTGSHNPKKILLETGLQNEKIEFCYVTRSYFTRHGYGPFPTECDSSELFGATVEEKQNKENEFQGKFRYGYFDADRFSCEFTSDLGHMLRDFSNSEGVIAVTHLDETGGFILCPEGKFPAEKLDSLKYESFGETRDDVREVSGK